MVIELGDLMGGAAPNAGATAINDHTQITGTNQIQDASGNLVARGFLWEDGQIRDLGVDPDVSPATSTTGTDRRIQLQCRQRLRPFLWEAGRTTILETLLCPEDRGGSTPGNQR